MLEIYFKEMDQNRISVRSYKVLQQLLKENPRLKDILFTAKSIEELHRRIKTWVYEELGEKSDGIKYFENKIKGREALRKLAWKEIAGIRILDYLKNAGKKVENANLRNKTTVIQPFRILWIATRRGVGGAKFDFFTDMLELFRQFNGQQEFKLPTKEKVISWMNRHPSGTQEDVVKIREENKRRILKTMIRKMEKGKMGDPHYTFPSELSEAKKLQMAMEWWDDWHFHLRFAIRDPENMNELLANSIMPGTIHILNQAKEAGIPFFANPYYLSLLNIREYDFGAGADQAIRDYVFYSQQLIDEFGSIEAWEKEDKVKKGEPNAAGWILPSEHNIHRRYPEVAIIIPDTMGRACAGLCVSCQRMYDFQRGHLNFNLERLKPNETWKDRLDQLMNYFENDSQLRDILITGGDALMSADKSLKQILEAIYQMAVRKREANKLKPDGEKYAEMIRVRLGTRLPVYLPQRITDSLAQILADFKERAMKIGISQFVIQTHFISAMEVTPEAVKAIGKLQQAGWIVTNQLVFTTAASVRGHAIKLRKVLNDAGVISYYTFSVKGFKENMHNFATNARAVQESVEEKRIGIMPKEAVNLIRDFPKYAEEIQEQINPLREKWKLPFLATDRTVMNIPGVGKSLTYRVIGITRFGHRILEFKHDHTRTHSPIIGEMGNFVVVESKTIRQYLRQLERLGEDPSEYETLYGYSIGETEQRLSIFEYPEYQFRITENYSNLNLE